MYKNPLVSDYLQLKKKLNEKASVRENNDYSLIIIVE